MAANRKDNGDTASKDQTFKTAIVTNMRDKSTEYQIPDGSHETDLALETIKQM